MANVDPRFAVQGKHAGHLIEHALLDTMYELPGMENVEKVVIDENMITGDTPPLLIYADQPKVSGSN